MKFQLHFKQTTTPIVLSLSLILGACSSITQPESIQASNEVSIDKTPDNLPEKWQAKVQNMAIDQTNSWMLSFDDPLLLTLLKKAENGNFQLQQQAYAVMMKELQLHNAGSQFWPDLTASLNTSRAKNNATQSISTNSSLQLSSRYELDLWGKLSAGEQKANLEWLAQKANYQQNKQQLSANIANAYFSSISYKKLWELELKRSNNIKQNLSIIESGYQQGLNSSLDVYLTRNEYNSALSSVQQKKEAYLSSLRKLQSYVADYPSADVVIAKDLPPIGSRIATGTPLDIIKRKPSIKASWYQLLANDAGLAVAHKQRFPSITFSASFSSTESDFSDLLSSGSLGWSLLNNISAPIFQAGRLKNNEEIARLGLKQSEQQYLDTLYKSFTQVEDLLSAEDSTQNRYDLQKKAEENAKAAYELSFGQYQDGLTIYTTVLDAQNRWYTAQSNMIFLQQLQLSNRINLFLALGGDFDKQILTNTTNLNE